MTKKNKELARQTLQCLLPDRSSCAEELARAVERAQKVNTRFAVMSIDVDNFKQVNETFDHQRGDLFLAEVAKRLQSALAEVDFLAWMGGDEFIVITGPVDVRDDVVQKAERIVSALDESISVDGKKISTSVSVGLAMYPDSGLDVATLFKHADIALSAVKELGGKGCQFFSASFNAARQRTAAIEEQLRHAFEKKELSYAYQPIIEIASQDIMGFEVLMRWENESLQSVSPSEFIPIADDMNVLTPFTEWLMQESPKALMVDKAGDERWRHCKVSFNISVRFLSNKLSRAFIEDLIRQTSLQPEQIVIELTETQLVKDIEASAKIMKEVASLGVQFAIDDFGTGYSSLSYLKRLPLHYLKIDKSFIDGCSHEADDAALTRATIQMGHALGLKVIAEGVESKEQADFLVRNACDYIQGYYYAKPLMTDDLDDFMKDWEKKRGGS